MHCAILLRCFLAAFLSALWTAPAGAIGTTPPSWKPRETVTSTLAGIASADGTDRMLAYDHHGNPGIAFYSTFHSDLRYARRVPGVGWAIVAVDTDLAVGLYASLAYDRYERPAISYYDSFAGSLKFARLNGSVWQKETIAASNGGEYSSLAFDLLGRPAIAYRDLNNKLSFMHDTDGDLSFVDEQPMIVSSQPGNDDYYYASLAFDHMNRPMIAHVATNGGDRLLQFSVHEPGIGWLTTTVDSIGPFSAADDHSLAIDPDTGFPAIAYVQSAGFDLRYAAWDGHAWNLATVDATVFVGSSPSLAFDLADGNPAIAYSNNGNSDLKLAWHDGSIWQTQTVDAVGNVGYSPSLAFNDYGSGFPSIGYFDDGTSLFFIDDPPATVPEPAGAMLLAIGLALGAVSGKRRLGR